MIPHYNMHILFIKELYEQYGSESESSEIALEINVSITASYTTDTTNCGS